MTDDNDNENNKPYNDGYGDDDYNNDFSPHLEDQHSLIFKVIKLVDKNYTGIEQNQKMIRELISNMEIMSKRIKDLESKIGDNNNECGF
jgi:hypothetical protein